MIYEYVVVGTSFGALGCINGLLKSKKKILCIDGAEILNEGSNKKDHYDFDYTKQNIPIKKFKFNKEYKDFFKPIEVLESHSFGGLSNVWGGSALRYLKDDFESWPISYEKLKRFYTESENIMNIHHYNDEISKELNIEENLKNDTRLNLYSEFIKSFIKKYIKNDNYTIGYSRIALNEDLNAFCTKNFIEKLIKEKKIEYKKNLILEKFYIKEDKSIELKFKNSDIKIFAKKLFLGAGALNTPKIVINSLKNREDLTVKESQVFFIPAIFSGQILNNNSNYHTLTQSQFFYRKNIKFNIGKISYQIKYDPKLTIMLLKKQFGLFYKLIPNFLIKRIFFISGFINSNHSTYCAKIKKEDLKVEIIEEKNNKKKIKYEILNQLKILEKKHSFKMFKLFLKLGDFGISYHLGASIPMIKDERLKKEDKIKLYTKQNGEISLFGNVFIIDSSNFTNIPSGPISLTIMANALRIANENINDK